MASLLPSFVATLAGIRSAGTIRAFGSTCVTTRFLHVLTLPVVPLSSRLVLDAPIGAGEVACPLPLQRPSVVAAYGRAWAPVAGVILGVMAGLGLAGGTAWDGVALLLGGLAAVCAVAAAAVARMGRLSDDECAQRYVYMDLLGYPADAAEVDLPGVAERIVERCDALARELSPGAPDWLAIADDAGTQSLPFLRTALTRARWEWARAAGERKDSLARVHARVWERLRAACPDVLEDVRAMR